MSRPEDVDRRLTAVEQGLAELRQLTAQTSVDAGAARTLAAGADRDVSEVRAELRAHLSVLNALRETQVEHGTRLDPIDARLDQVDARFDQIDTRFGEVAAAFTRVDTNFASVERQFGAVHAGLAQIVTLVEGLDR